MMGRTIAAIAACLTLSASVASGQVIGTAPTAAAGGTWKATVPAAPVPPPTLPLTMPRVMVFGDSHAQYQQLANAQAINRPSGLWETAWQANPRFNFDWWVSATSPLFSGVDGADQGLGGDHLDWTNNGGVGNVNFIDGCLNRSTYAASRAPQIVWVSCGTNSIASGDNTGGAPILDATYITGKLNTIINQFTQRGIWVILPTEYSRGDWPLGDARHQTVLDVNAWIRAQAGRTGVKVMDAYALLTDPADTTATMPNPAYFLEGAAGVHLNVAGAQLVYSQVLKPVIESMTTAGSQIITDPTSAANLIPAQQALMNGGTAGATTGTPAPTGVVPTGFAVQTIRGSSATVSSIEDAGTYKRTVLQITPVADASSTVYHQVNVVFSKKPLNTTIPSGSWVRYMVHVETPDTLSAAMIRAYLRVFDAGNNVLAPAGAGIWNSESSSEFAKLGVGRGGYWLSSKPFQIGAVGTQADMQMEIYWSRTQGGSFTVKVDRPILTVIPDPRPAWNLP